MKVVKIAMTSIICTSLDNIDGGDTGIKYGGGSSSTARSRSFGGFDDWDEE